MTPQSFNKSLPQNQPPSGLSVPLQALWWARKNDWDRAHQIVQDLESPSSANVHAYLHRVEGDLENAAYWYRRAGVGVAEGALIREWQALVERLLSQAPADSASR